MASPARSPWGRDGQGSRWHISGGRGRALLWHIESRGPVDRTCWAGTSSAPGGGGRAQGWGEERKRRVKRKSENERNGEGIPALKTINSKKNPSLEPQARLVLLGLPRLHQEVRKAGPQGPGGPPTSHPGRVVAAEAASPPTPTHCCSALARSLRKKRAVARKNMPPRTTTKGQSMRA